MNREKHEMPCPVASGCPAFDSAPRRVVCQILGQALRLVQVSPVFGAA